MPQPTTAHRGFFPVVTGEAVTIQQAGATVVMSRSTTSVTQGGAQVMLTGGDAVIHQGGANLLGVAGDASLTQGGAVVAAAGSIEARNSYLGIAIAPSITLSEGSRVLIGPREAAIVGVVATVGYWALRGLFGRTR
ncbi:MAG: hypothetical protein HKN74_03390 [Acidimicrobiia bacterium]|nr:hypothetical protein [Acidimicrobiia bacterium]NNF09307.1 hypothetical protein [Acidimicrobiia bacterium]